MIKSKTGRVTENNWTQVLYDLRSLLLPPTKRGSVTAKKLILFTIAAAGIPSNEYPQAGYKQRLEILAQQTGMDKRALKIHLKELEDTGLLIKKYLGPSYPKWRFLNAFNLRKVVKSQRKDFEAWLELNGDIDEDQPAPLFIPIDYHLGDLDPWRVDSSNSLDTPIDTPLGAPIETPTDTFRDINESKNHLGDSKIQNCSTQHGICLSCVECDLEEIPSKSRDFSGIDPWAN